MRKILLLGAAAACAVNPVAVTAEEADTPTLLAYLGLSAAEGKTSVGENAAAVEAAMLVSALAVAAAGKIKTNIERAAAGAPVVFVSKDEKFSLLPYRQADRMLDKLETDIAQFRNLSPADCTRVSKGGQKSLDGSPALTAEPTRNFKLKPSDILGAFKTSADLTAAPFDPSVELMKAALGASSGGLKWTSPSDVIDTSENIDLRTRVAAIEAAVKPYAGKTCPAKEDIAKTADAILAATASLTASKDGAPSLLDQAGAVAWFGEKQNLRILRFEVAKAGGTLVNTSNIWTSLGIPGLNMRGGLVTSYRLIDPTKGETLAAGIVSCRYPNRLLLEINKKPVNQKEAICDTIAAIPPESAAS